MDKSKKMYIKALDKYNDGYIDDALKLCERSISIDINNSASINLKGLLYYLKGDLDQSRNLWTMNSRINKDGVSEKYLKDTEKDLDRRIKFERSLKLIKQLKINEALELLNECSNSDYNVIDVNNYKALCYIKKGEFNRAKVHVEKVINIDKKNKFAKDNMKNIEKFGVSLNSVSNKRVSYKIIGVVAVITLVVAFVYLFKNANFKTNTSKGSVATIKKQEVVREKVKKESKKEEPKKEESKKEEIFPRDVIQKDFQNKNFDDLYLNLFKWKDKNISVNDKSLLASVDKLLKDEGVEYFYKKGNEFVASKNFENAKQNLIKAYNLGANNYLYPHIIYILGSSFEALGDVENAIKYYTQYDKKYPNDDYEETVLYNLANIYKNIDKEKAEFYAQKLVDKYDSSIYNNSVIQKILNN